MINRDAQLKLNWQSPAPWLATWFGCGLIKSAPGTWGTLGGLPFGIGFLYLGGPWALFVGVAVVTPIGWWATQKVEAATGDHDAGYIVIDEVAGIWLTLMAAVFNPLSILLAFFLFRLFDIVKPWPCNWLDQKLTGPGSVMLDDLMAGFYAALCLLGLRYVGIG